jgi:hypothetical protein
MWLEDFDPGFSVALWQGSVVSNGQQRISSNRFQSKKVSTSHAVERAYFPSIDSILGAAAPQQLRCHICILRESGSIWSRLLH